GPIMLAIGVALVSAFTIYPFAVLSRLRSQLRDKDVRGALRIFASAFSLISITLLAGDAVSSFGYSIQGTTNFLSVILIIVAVRAFRKPTFLKSFLGVVPSLESSPTASHYDHFSVRTLQTFVQHLTDPKWASPDHSLHVLVAFDSTVFRGEEAYLAQLENKIRTLDLSESMDTFSSTVGLSHEEITGKKLLLEFDPQSDYDRIFKSLLAESASHFERTVVFTLKGRPVYSLAQR